jgi:ribosomal protein S18 acetylase RimI-like enzyme
MKIDVISAGSHTTQIFHKEATAAFLYKQLGRCTDTETAISKAIDYALSSEPGKGGIVLNAIEDNRLVSALVLTQTGMDDFIPEYILVYVAVHEAMRCKGIGMQLIKKAMECTEGSIALQVKHDNPAIKLYERLGFSSKYREMRLNRNKEK